MMDIAVRLSPPELLDIPLSHGAVSRVRLYPKPGKPRLLFCHGTGLASDGFSPFWNQFADRYELIVMDMRGHGHNQPGTASPIRPELLVEDLLAILGSLEVRLGSMPTVGLFHSLAGVIGLRASVLAPTAFAGLVLFEPPVLPAQVDDGVRAVALRVAASTRRRRASFEAPESLARSLQSLAPTASIPAENALTLARAMLRPGSDCWTLRCAPDIEAELYLLNNNLGLWDTPPPAALPILLQSGAAPHAADNFGPRVIRQVADCWGADLMQVGASSHFAWLVSPDTWADLTVSYLDTLRLGESADPRDRG